MDNNQLTPEAKFILTTRNSWEMNQVEFGRYIAEGIRPTPFSRQNVWAWENNQQGINALDVALGSINYPDGDRRREFYVKLLAIKNAEREATNENL